MKTFEFDMFDKYLGCNFLKIFTITRIMFFGDIIRRIRYYSFNHLIFKNFE